MDIEKDQSIEEQLKILDEAITFAEENHGDTEVRDAIMKKADFYHQKNMIVEAKKTYLEAYEKSVGVSNRLEIYNILLLIFFGENNLEDLKKYIDKCKVLLEEGGDWERKNKLKVYEGLYCLIIRDFKTAAVLLIDSLSTFSSPELISFEKLTFYSVISGLMTLTRHEIKEKVLFY